MLLRGNSVRSREQLTDLHRDTILRLLVVAGERCEKVIGRLVVNVPVGEVQCDEIWGYVYKKECQRNAISVRGVMGQPIYFLDSLATICNSALTSLRMSRISQSISIR